ncbi:MAG: VOC family protein [Verrucomicrobiales bacterium]
MPLSFTIEHIGLAARDTTRLKDWYVQVLGARLVFEAAQTPPAYFLQVGGGLLIEIYPYRKESAEVSDNGLAGWRHIALSVPSLEKARAELVSAGVAITEPVKPAGGGGQVQFFQDPEGNLLHLIERPAPLPGI